MRTRRSLFARAMSVAMLILSGIVATPAIFAVQTVFAQSEAPPDLRMLLNLDLFKPVQNAPAQSGADGDGSMLDQIQTLNALGYLAGKRPAPAGATPPSANDGNTEEIAPAPNNPAPHPIPSEPEVVE